MSDLIYKFFGEGKDLTALQMGDRAFVMFFVTLILLRIGGLRAFGQQSAFDNVIVIMLGAILSRAVVGASPFLPIVIAGFVLVFVHRILAVISMYNDFVSDLIKGKPTSLYKNGKLNEKNMRRCDITKGDLMEGLRHNANLESLEEAKDIFLERNGHISVVKK
jgi:uncharacterized membrane protein YcaP (DUF421 family)